MKKLLVPISAFVFLACSILPSAGQSSEPAGERAQLQQLLEEIRKEHNVPGATAAAVFADGSEIAVAVGFADLEEQIPMTPDTRMPAGSVGKTFVAATAIALWQEGKLGLDDKMSRWLGEHEWFERVPNAEDLTVRHLLRHRGGLPDHVYFPEFHQAILGVRDPDFYLRPAQLMAFVFDKEPLFPAGEDFSYADTGYILLGMVIEKAGGKPYYQQLRERFLDPLGFERTLPADRRQLPEVAAGYLDRDPLGLPFTKTMRQGSLMIHPLNEWTGGGLVSTSLELARWAKALYEGKALPKPYLDELLACPGKGDSCYGLGVFVEQGPEGPAYGHPGWFPGYITRMTYLDDHDMAVALQVNVDHQQQTRAYLARIVDLLAPQ